jgi:hypothetical protein
LALNERASRARLPSVFAWLRSNALGLVAIILLLTGTAVAANVASKPDASKKPDQAAATKAKKKKSKRGPSGPAGPAGAVGPQGPQGAPGQQGVAGPGATRLVFDQLDSDNQLRPIGSAGDLKLFAICSVVAAKTAVGLAAQSNGSGGLLFGTREASENGGAPTQQTPWVELGIPQTPASLSIFPSQAPVNPNGILTAFMQGTYINDANTQAVTFQIVATADDSLTSCDVHGTAVPAS